MTHASAIDGSSLASWVGDVGRVHRVGIDADHGGIGDGVIQEGVVD